MIFNPTFQRNVLLITATEYLTSSISMKKYICVSPLFDRLISIRLCLSFWQYNRPSAVDSNISYKTNEADLYWVLQDSVQSTWQRESGSQADCFTLIGKSEAQS